MTVDLKSLTARDVMTKEPQWATADESVREAADRMLQHSVRALLVRGSSQGDLPGIITSKDIVNLLAGHDQEMLDHATVQDVMTRPAICVPAATHLFDCINLMRMNGIRRIPVLDDLEVIGILSSSDVFRVAFAPA